MGDLLGTWLVAHFGCSNNQSISGTLSLRVLARTLLGSKKPRQAPGRGTASTGLAPLRVASLTRKNLAADKEKKLNHYHGKNSFSVKRMTVEADSAEELIDKIKNIEWEKQQDRHSGERFSFIV